MSEPTPPAAPEPERHTAPALPPDHAETAADVAALVQKEIG